MGGSDSQTLKAFVEADSYEGPSLIIAYSHCINPRHRHVRAWNSEAGGEIGRVAALPLRPALGGRWQEPLQLDSKAPSIKVSEYAYNETRYRMLLQSDEERAEMLMKAAQEDAERRWSLYEQWQPWTTHSEKSLKEKQPQA
jgi:pyruvate-ferredoxin/flavodoxin oxidoreductase